MVAISLQSTRPASRTPSQPPPPTDGGRKDRVGLGFHQLLLDAGRSRAPEVREVVGVMTVLPVRHERRLAPYEPGRRAVTETLGHLGERQADGAEAIERRQDLLDHMP